MFVEAKIVHCKTPDKAPEDAHKRAQTNLVAKTKEPSIKSKAATPILKRPALKKPSPKLHQQPSSSASPSAPAAFDKQNMKQNGSLLAPNAVYTEEPVPSASAGMVATEPDTAALPLTTSDRRRRPEIWISRNGVLRAFVKRTTHRALTLKKIQTVP